VADHEVFLCIVNRGEWLECYVTSIVFEEGTRVVQGWLNLRNPCVVVAGFVSGYDRTMSSGSY
jgi:hypothetical protein